MYLLYIILDDLLVMKDVTFEIHLEEDCQVQSEFTWLFD